MGILNVTPDSFSDGGKYCSTLGRPEWSVLESTLDRWDQVPVAMIDVGAESTRPGSSAVSETTEWERLAPVLDFLKDRYAGSVLAPAISVDTRRSAIASKAIGAGATIINDVGGASDPAMRAVVAQAGCAYIAMHSRSIPADPGNTLLEHEDAVREIAVWAKEVIDRCLADGIEPQNLWIDPGIGFGKTSLQSFELLRSLGSLQELEHPIVIGHSRKSFLKDLSPSSVAADRDPETLGVSLALIDQGVDILRVHDPVMHAAAWKGWASARGSG
jgi:dihydropteroate synthase